MAVQITSYGGLTAAIAAWLARDGDSDIAARADDFIALCETRMYYGAEALPTVGLGEHEAIRIPEMYQSNPAFAVTQGGPQPTGMLELVEAQINGSLGCGPSPLSIVEESILDSKSPFDSDMPSLVALSGPNLRYWPAPAGSTWTATFRYYGALLTPNSTNATNWILSNAPAVYLNGCLLEAAIFTGDADSAKLYHALYGSAANGLNIRKQRILASAQNVRVMMRGRTP